jgi:hypothetical protein
MTVNVTKRKHKAPFIVRCDRKRDMLRVFVVASPVIGLCSYSRSRSVSLLLLY